MKATGTKTLLLIYLQQHLAVLSEMVARGIDIRGYYVWSLLDNFEWASGYEKRFGIVHVDYTTQQRTLKDSALWYRDFLQVQRSARGKPAVPVNTPAKG